MSVASLSSASVLAPAIALPSTPSNTSTPTQLELPAMPPRVERVRPLARCKRIPPPVHLMADIPATGGYRPVGEDTALAPALYAQDAGVAGLSAGEDWVPAVLCVSGALCYAG